MLYIGIDLGTSAVKLLLMDEEGRVWNEATKIYPLEFPKPGWSQQDPQKWKSAVLEGIESLLANFDKSELKGIGVGGQMHGLVVLDENDEIIRPAILWNDGRAEKQTEFLNEVIGRDRLSQLTANIAFAGFTAPKILWMKENEPELFSKIARIMLPKDYINYILTGVHCCDYSDASGTLLLDVEHRCWSKEMLNICGIQENQLPKLFESYEPIGTLLPEIVAKLGLPENVIVAAGAGDNAAAAIGTGTIGSSCNISLGTSGTIFISSDKFNVDPYNALHAFAHADGGWHLMGCMLSAASCNKWLMEDIFHTEDYFGEQSQIPMEKLGRNSVYFLPYLMGERSPINDVDARGVFVGMSLGTTRSDMVLAVMEGVAFAIRDSFEVVKKLGIQVEKSKISGGGTKSELWKKILANILNVELQSVGSEQGPAMGGAMLAMVACGEYTSVNAVCSKLVQITDNVEPDQALVALYEERYQKFKKIYPEMKKLFQDIREEY